MAMNDIAGMIKPELQALPQIKDRMTFLYLEHCKLNREDSAITIRDEKGIISVPAAVISVLMLGPGTNISHRAMELIGDAGVTVIWVGEHGVRYYASGRPLTHSANMLIHQAQFVSNQHLHLNVARKMYQIRFPGEDVSKLTMQQLRGKEGSRVRAVYREYSKKWNIPWDGRNYKVEDFASGNPVNQALSAGNACLYGLAHAVIVAMGCSPGLGFVHVGHENSFVYDIADLYKAEITIPAAFEIAAENPSDLSSVTRQKIRDLLVANHILERMVHDIRWLLSENSDKYEKDVTLDEVYLWNNQNEIVQNGISYGKEGQKNK
ncbi:MAG: type I-E CRISPR-associated endonuclease Cas1e [Lachnospiraceae bacterium]